MARGDDALVVQAVPVVRDDPIHVERWRHPMSESPDTEYTPTTAEIREYVEVGGEPRPWEPVTEESDVLDARREAAFNRWLAAHDAEVAAAERERCARIADAEGSNSYPGEDAGYMAERIAARIREGNTE